MKVRVFVFMRLVLLPVLLLGLGFICTACPGKNEAVMTAAPVKKAGVSDAVYQGEAAKSPQPEIKKSEKGAEVKTKSEPLRIVAVGDIMLGRGVGMRLEKQNKGYTYPFERVSGILKKGDVIFGNLEAPITDRTHCLDTKYKFVLRNKVKAFEGLKYAGFNLLSLANNHILDYYAEGLNDTIDMLEEHGISYSGAGKNLDEARKPAVVEKKGVKIGMLSYTDMAKLMYKGNPPISFAACIDSGGVAPMEYDYIREDIKKIRDNVDILIVSLHWGVEESFDVLPEQVEFAHNLLDQGADIILGHHPHQFQGIEIYNGKPVFYSLGNFIFDQNDPENQESFIINMEYNGKRLSALTAIPVRTIDKTQVVPVMGQDAADLLKRQVELSSRLNSKGRIEDDRIVFELKQP